jgi:polysaccharide biosynthesis transport protein
MNESLDIRYYLFVVKRRFLHFLAPMLACLVLATAVIMSLPRVYNSSAKILVESQSVPIMTTQAAVPTFAIERIQKIQQRALTRENLLNMADKFQLFGDRKNLSKTEIVDVMRSRITFEMLELGASNARPKANEKVAIAFAVGFDHESPTAANQVANELVNIVLEEDSRVRVGTAESSEKFVERELNNLKRNLAETDEKISAFKIQNSAQLPEKLAFNMQLIEKQDAEVNSIERDEIAGRNQQKLLEIEANVLRAGSKNKDGQQITGGVANLEQQLNGLESEYVQKKVLFSETHPEMRRLRNAIAVLSSEVEKMQSEFAGAKPLDSNDPSLSIELRLIAQKAEMIDRQIELNTKRRDELKKSVTALRDIVAKTPEIGAQLQSLERTREAQQSSVDDFQLKLQATEINKRIVVDQEGERFDVIEPPVVPQEPIRPKRAQLLLMALAASIGLGGATAFGSEFMDSTVRRGRDITHKLNSRLIVTIPYIKTRSEIRKSRGKAGLYVLGAIALTALLLLLLNFYTPIDVLFYQQLNKLGG